MFISIRTARHFCRSAAFEMGVGQGIGACAPIREEQIALVMSPLPVIA